jgi:hypothetical protein
VQFDLATQRDIVNLIALSAVVNITEFVDARPFDKGH